MGTDGHEELEGMRKYKALRCEIYFHLHFLAPACCVLGFGLSCSPALPVSVLNEATVCPDLYVYGRSSQPNPTVHVGP